MQRESINQFPERLGIAVEGRRNWRLLWQFFEPGQNAERDVTGARRSESFSNCHLGKQS